MIRVCGNPGHLRTEKRSKQRLAEATSPGRRRNSIGRFAESSLRRHKCRKRVASSSPLGRVTRKQSNPSGRPAMDEAACQMLLQRPHLRQGVAKFPEGRAGLARRQESDGYGLERRRIAATVQVAEKAGISGDPFSEGYAHTLHNTSSRLKISNERQLVTAAHCCFCVPLLRNCFAIPSRLTV